MVGGMWRGEWGVILNEFGRERRLVGRAGRVAGVEFAGLGGLEEVFEGRRSCEWNGWEVPCR